MQETSMSSKINTCFSYCRRHSGQYFVCVSLLPVRQTRKAVYISLISTKLEGGSIHFVAHFLKEKYERNGRILDMLFNKISL